MKKLSIMPVLVMASGSALAVDVDIIHSGFNVGGIAQENVFATPMAFSGGSLFTVNVEPPPSSINSSHPHYLLSYRTVIRQGQQDSDGKWSWESKVINDKTHKDRWHNAPSIGSDKNGYLHIAYNMHNMPWQYQVSNSPASIDGFTFKGQAISFDQQKRSRLQNRTSYPTPGSAAIPGNQVTYPAFFNDRQGELFITYRHALKPKNPWSERVFGSGIAKYDTQQQTWASIGGDYTVKQGEAELGGPQEITIKPFAQRSNWALYQTRLAFDQSNNMHVFWYWRNGGAGPELTHPSYAMSSDGGYSFKDINGNPYSLPISLDQIAPTYPNTSTKFSSSTTVSVNASGEPIRVLGDLSQGKHKLASYDKSQERWVSEDTPWSAPLVFFDRADTQWAVASGPVVFRRDASTNNQWKQIYSEAGWGSPKALQHPNGSGFFLHMQSRDKQRIRMWQFTTREVSEPLPSQPSNDVVAPQLSAPTPLAVSTPAPVAATPAVAVSAPVSAPAAATPVVAAPSASSLNRPTGIQVVIN